jgi:outer membrane lipoprotein-sorting protein
MSRATSLLALAALILLVPSTGCVFRTRVVEIRESTAKLDTANQEQLVAQINTEAAKIQTLNATVDIGTSTGGAKKGKVTEYEEIKGYVLVRRPHMLRMIGLLPVVRSKAFDMVSDGNEFKLSIPPTNKFYVGHNEVTVPSANPLENLRPQHIYDALLLHQIDPQNEIAVLESGVERVIDPKTKRQAEQPDYIIDVIRRSGDSWRLDRKIMFDRVGLVPHRQVIYDKKGSVATDATYSNFKLYNDMNFPAVIQIWRPQEEYRISLVIEKLTVNQPITDDQFALQQPPGSLLMNLDNKNQNAAAPLPTGVPPRNSGKNDPPPKL